MYIILLCISLQTLTVAHKDYIILGNFAFSVI